VRQKKRIETVPYNQDLVVLGHLMVENGKGRLFLMGKGFGKGAVPPTQKIVGLFLWKWRVLVHFGTILSNWVGF